MTRVRAAGAPCAQRAAPFHDVSGAGPPVHAECVPPEEESEPVGFAEPAASSRRVRFRDAESDAEPDARRARTQNEQEHEQERVSPRGEAGEAEAMEEVGAEEKGGEQEEGAAEGWASAAADAINKKFDLSF